MGANMEINYSLSLVAVGNLARELQAKSADSKHIDQVYELATKIKQECQVIIDHIDGVKNV